MKKCISYLTLSIAALSMNYAVAIDQKSCEGLLYGPYTVAENPKSTKPSRAITPSFKYCEGNIKVKADMDSSNNFPVEVANTQNDVVCKQIKGVISADQQDQEYFKHHIGKSLKFRACLKPSLNPFIAPDTEIVIGDTDRSEIISENMWKIRNMYAENRVLEHIIHRDNIKELFKLIEYTKPLPEKDTDECSLDLIQHLNGYTPEFTNRNSQNQFNEKWNSNKGTITCGELFDTMSSSVVIPELSDVVKKAGKPENEIIQAMSGKYHDVSSYPYINRAEYEKLPVGSTWGEFLDKALIGSPYTEKIEVGDGSEFRSIK